MKNFLAGMLFATVMFWLGVYVAEAATSETTLTVVIQDEISSSSTINMSASVPCNEINCPVEQLSTWSKVVNWFRTLWNG